jgi:hypothetical protein
MSPFVQQVFADFSDSAADFMSRANRTTMKASMFDALRRTEVTLPAYTAVVPLLFRDIAAKISPEDLGKVLRRPATRPNPMHVAGAPWQMLLERERRAALSMPPIPDEDFEYVLDFAGRVLGAMRADGSLFPCSRTGWHMRIMDPGSVESLVSSTYEPSDQDVALLRRMSASLELYSFMLHGEHRDGFFEHGPYPLEDGRIAVIKDFTDLRSEFLPWSAPETRLPFPALSIVLVLDEKCAPVFNWAGTMSCSGELYEQLRGVAVLAIAAGSAPEQLRLNSWTPLERTARQAQKNLFMAIAKWPDTQKIMYGLWLFANHLQEFPRFLGLPGEVTANMLAKFECLVNEEYERLDFTQPSPMWAALRRSQPFTALEMRT